MTIIFSVHLVHLKFINIKHISTLSVGQCNMMTEIEKFSSCIMRLKPFSVNTTLNPR